MKKSTARKGGDVTADLAPIGPKKGRGFTERGAKHKTHGTGGCSSVFFFFVTIFGLPVKLLEKVPVTKNAKFCP